MSPETAPEERNRSRKSFSLVGFGLSAALLLTAVIEVMAEMFAASLIPSPTERGLLCTAAMCLIAFPIGGWVISRAGKSALPAGTGGGFAVYAVFLALAVELALVGSVCGDLLTGTGLEEGAALDTVLSNPRETVLYLAVVAVVSPFCEEMFFRRTLAGSLRQWGWLCAVILSSLFYGMFRGSVAQMIYGVLFGAALSYVYLYTGKIRYSVLIHGTVNLLFVAVPTLSASFLCDFETLETFENALMQWAASGYTEAEELAGLLEKTPGAVPALLINTVIGALELGLAVAGAVLLFTLKKRMRLEKGDRKLERRNVGDTVFMAPGIFVYILLAIAVMVLNVYF